MKAIYITTCCALALSACTPAPAPEPAKTPPASPGAGITTVTHTVDGMREMMKLDVRGREVIVALEWRNFSNVTDMEVPKWYGDMGRPRAKYVVKSLTVSVDGKGVAIPAANYRYLASQWMNGTKHLGVYKSGKDLNIYVNVGDGAEGWTASYVVNPATGTLVSHKVYDGPEFHNQFAP